MKNNFEHDIIQVVKLGEHYQLKYIRFTKLGGFENTDPPKLPSKSNSFKLKNNISRACTTCRNIALSNHWDYFITLTINPKLFNPYAIDDFKKELTSFLKKINRSYGVKIEYLLVPEKHKSGAWHLHGLINLPSILLSKNSNGYLDFPLYSEKFGFCSISKIENNIGVAFYISKHLSKQLQNGIEDKFKHLYIVSRGLNRGEIVSVLHDYSLPGDFNFQYESEDGSFKSSFFEDDTFLKSLDLI